jgi:hypothetical protein
LVCGRLAEFVHAQLSGDILKDISEQYRNFLSSFSGPVDDLTANQRWPPTSALRHPAARVDQHQLVARVVDMILFTHFHFDHLWGISDGKSASLLFPSAEFVASETEVAFWSDPELPEVPSAAVIRWGCPQLSPERDRLLKMELLEPAEVGRLFEAMEGCRRNVDARFAQATRGLEVESIRALDTLIFRVVFHCGGAAVSK